MDIELALEVLSPDLGDRSEAGRQPRSIEQAIQPAELENRLAKECVERRVVAHVYDSRYHSAREAGGDLGCDSSAARLIEIRHHNVGTLFGKAPGGGLADPAAAPDYDDHVPWEQLGRPLLRDLLFDLAALEWPVLELEDVLLGDELEAVHHLRIRDGLQHGAVAEIRGDGAAFVVKRGDQAYAGDQQYLGPIIERALPGSGV